MCEMSLLGLSKLPWAQRWVTCTGLIWGSCLVVRDIPARLEQVTVGTEGGNLCRTDLGKLCV